jgi:hypothetical protein
MPLLPLNLVLFRPLWSQNFAAFIFNLRAALRMKSEEKHVATPASTLQQKAVWAPYLPGNGDLKPSRL